MICSLRQRASARRRSEREAQERARIILDRAAASAVIVPDGTMEGDYKLGDVRHESEPDNDAIRNAETNTGVFEEECEEDV